MTCRSIWHICEDRRSLYHDKLEQAEGHQLDTCSTTPLAAARTTFAAFQTGNPRPYKNYLGEYETELFGLKVTSTFSDLQCVYHSQLHDTDRYALKLRLTGCGFLFSQTNIDFFLCSFASLLLCSLYTPALGNNQCSKKDTF